MKKIETRQDEIDVLKSLKGDTYFSQFFGDDIDQMCENIRNDFPIENGCDFNREAEAVKSELRTARMEIRDKALEIVNLTFSTLGVFITKEIQEEFEKKVGKMNVLIIKHANKVPMSEDDINYLFEKAQER